MSLFNNKLYMGGEPFLLSVDCNISKGIIGNGFRNENIQSGQYWKFYNYDNKLFCGCSYGVLCINPDNSKSIISLPSTIFSISSIYNKKDVLVACSGNQAYLLKKENNKWRYESNIGGYHSFYKSLGVDKNDYLWSVSINGGIIRMKFNTNYNKLTSIERFCSKEGIADSLDCTVFIANGEVYANSANYLYCFDEKLKKFKVIYHNPRVKNVDVLNWNHKDTVWATTELGLSRLVKQSNDCCYKETKYFEFGPYYTFYSFISIEM